MKKFCFITLTICLSVFLSSCSRYSSSDLEDIEKDFYSIYTDIESIKNESAEYLENAEYLLEEGHKIYDTLENMYGPDYPSELSHLMDEIRHFLSHLPEELSEMQTDLEYFLHDHIYYDDQPPTPRRQF